MIDRATKDTIKRISVYSIWSVAVVMVVFTGSVFLIKMSPYSVVDVRGVSMEPTFNNGDKVVIKDELGSGGDIARNSIVLFKVPDGWNIKHDEANTTELVKRVVGVPGDTVTYKNDTIEIVDSNGKSFTLDNPRYKSYVAPVIKTFTIPEGKFVVAGDNREQSFDSIVAWCSGEEPMVDRSRIHVSGKIVKVFHL